MPYLALTDEELDLVKVCVTQFRTYDARGDLIPRADSILTKLEVNNTPLLQSVLTIIEDRRDPTLEWQRQDTIIFSQFVEAGLG